MGLKEVILEHFDSVRCSLGPIKYDGILSIDKTVIFSNPGGMSANNFILVFRLALYQHGFTAVLFLVEHDGINK